MLTPNGSRKHVGERRAARVVKVQRQPLDRDARQHDLQNARHLAWMRDADRVAHRHLEHTHLQQAPGNVGDPLRRHRALERAAERGRQ